MDATPESSSSSNVHDKSLNGNTGKEPAPGEKKKSAVPKAVRACNNCRTTRTRCIGCDDPPCKRCRNANLECVFAAPPKDPGLDAEQRIQGLEREMGGVQSSLQEILSHLRGVPFAPPPILPSPVSNFPSSSQQQRPWNASPSFNASSPNPAASSSAFPSNFLASFSPSAPNSLAAFPSLQQHLHPSMPPSNHLPNLRHLPSAPINASSSYLPPPRPPSPARSDSSVEAGELPSSALLAPLSSIHSLAEAASEREHEPETSKKRDLDELNMSSGSAPKRVKFGEVSTEGEKPEQLDREVGLARGQLHNFTSSLQAGVVMDQEARRLHQVYWGGADQFLSVFDPQVDTYEKMKQEHPFCFSAICYVGASVEDNGGPISEKQRKLWDHLKQQAMQTLFSKTIKIGAVQALILTSGWNEYGWLSGGHAVRLGMDLGCSEAFSQLLATGMGAGKQEAELEADRELVAKARTGLVLFNFDHQMSYGNGRTPIVQVDEAILRCQELLNHPLSIETDIKVVSTTELMTIRAKYHKELSKLANEVSIDAATISLLGQANEEVGLWHQKWEALSAAAPSLADDRGRKRLREQSLLIQREYTNLFHNCFALRGVHSALDVHQMPPKQRDLALCALRNAQAAMTICLAPDSYRTNFIFAVHYTHVTAAFVGSLLIRIARLFPHELDLRKTAKDVDQLASLLASAGAGRYARSLRLMLRKARRRRVVPPSSAPPSRPGSPSNVTSRLPLSSLPPLQSTSLYPPPPTQFQPFPSPGAVFDPTAGAGTGSSPSNLFTFDWNYAQDVLASIGHQVDENGTLPLWLSDSDVGSNQLLSGGMEDFFLPSDIDLQLDLYTTSNAGSSQGGQTPAAEGWGAGGEGWTA